MTELTTVDFSRVKAALNLATQGAELEAERERAAIAGERSKATARLIVCSALAAAGIIISIGAAIWLARQRQVIEVGQQLAPPPKEIVVPAPLPEQPRVPDVPANKIKTNINQFNSIEAADLTLANPYFVALSAGHKYSSSNADRWDDAWCYAVFRRDGVKFQLDLESRSARGAVPHRASDNERRQLELSESDVAFLRARCPWKPQ